MVVVAVAVRSRLSRHSAIAEIVGGQGGCEWDRKDQANTTDDNSRQLSGYHLLIDWVPQGGLWTSK